LILVCSIVTGCKQNEKSDSPLPSPGSGYFKTPFQSESSFIVQAIVSDIGEQLVYAASRRTPDKSGILLSVSEPPDSAADTPSYNLQLRLDSKQDTQNTKVTVNEPIWSPAVYQKVTEELARTAG